MANSKLILDPTGTYLRPSTPVCCTANTTNSTSVRRLNTLTNNLLDPTGQY